MFEKEFRKPTTISEFRKTSWEEVRNFEKELRKNNSGEKKNIGKRMWEKKECGKKNIGKKECGKSGKTGQKSGKVLKNQVRRPLT